MLRSKLNSKPASDEIEVSLFGPNYGESVVLHLGGDEWAIVDSCLHPQTKKSAPLHYLNEIGVDPAQQVKLVVATHWHDDHIRGLSETVTACENAVFACSSAQGKREFLTLVQVMNARSMMSYTGISEFAAILATLQERQKRKIAFSVPKLAIEGRPIWRRPGQITPSKIDSEIIALSPSDASVMIALQRIAKLLPGVDTPKKRIPSLEPNDTSVVLWVRVGSLRILLGADLENTTDSARGWSAVLMEHASQRLGTASTFKVPHHGSVTGDHPAVWSEMLEHNPVALISPFLQGNKKLPTDEDARRIRSRTDRAYCTADFTPYPSPKRSKVVERTIREMVRQLRPAISETGHIRLRAKLNSNGAPNWTRELFGKAIPLDRLHSATEKRE